MIIPSSVLKQLEYFLNNFSFASLFLLVLSYWTQASFFSRNRYKWITSSLTWLSLLSLTSLLIARWSNSSHFPLSNLYESLIFLSWGFVIGHIVLGLVSKNDLLGTVTSPMALFTNGFATFSLPRDMQQVSSLVPALQSNWLMMHVSVMILSYVALFCGSLLSMAFLLLTSETLLDKSKATLEKINDLSTFLIDISHVFNPPTVGTQTIPTKVRKDDVDEHQPVTRIALYQGEASDSYIQYPLTSLSTKKRGVIGISNEKKRTYERLSPLALTLDNLSYRALGLGFPLLTVGILSGAVWANEAWGSYWSWDPKESWALITWLVFAIYLHMRLTKGWVGRKPAIIATIGFTTVWFCYLGVNLLGVGLHSYGWFQKNI